jgi:hypothetical protein
MVEHLPYPLGSLVLYKGVRFYIYHVHKYTGTYDLVYEKGGGTKPYNVAHDELQMMFHPATTCDWNKMLTALSK